MRDYKTVSKEQVFELTEKRSKFIATLRYVETEEQATAFINEMRATYWDARHNVYAYALNEGNIKRFSDDGEPHGTAGKPILEVIDGAGLKNVAIVVTRYFGGVLLGTGGLVRAYSGAAQGVIAAAEVKTMTECDELEIKCDYGMYDTLNNILKDISGGVISTDFTDSVIIKIYIAANKTEEFCAKITDIFGGKIEVNKINSKFYPI